MYELLAGKQRALVFPVMCNGHVLISKTNNIGTMEPFGIWDHSGDFTFEFVVTPYDINGYNQWSGVTKRSVANSKKIMPGIDTTGTITDYQSHLYLNYDSRLDHKMCLFHSTSLKIFLTNNTTNNENNPAAFKIELQLTIGGVTETFTSETIIAPDYGPALQYTNTYDNRGALRNGKFHFDRTATITTNFTGGGTTINCTPTTAFLENGGQEVFLWSSSGFVKVGTISTKAASSIVLSEPYSEDISLATQLYIRSYVEPTYVNGFYHVAVAYGGIDNSITLFLNGRPVLYDTHSSSNTFAFDDEDYYLGANGLAETGNNKAYTNNQFMGEFHEICLTNVRRTEFPSISNLLPNLNNTLLYLRFEEVDL